MGQLGQGWGPPWTPPHPDPGQEAEAWGGKLETGLGSRVPDAQLWVPTAASPLWQLGRQLFSFGL